MRPVLTAVPTAIIPLPAFSKDFYLLSPGSATELKGSTAKRKRGSVVEKSSWILRLNRKTFNGTQSPRWARAPCDCLGATRLFPNFRAEKTGALRSGQAITSNMRPCFWQKVCTAGYAVLCRASLSASISARHGVEGVRWQNPELFPGPWLCFWFPLPPPRLDPFEANQKIQKHEINPRRPTTSIAWDFPGVGTKNPTSQETLHSQLTRQLVALG